ncbi:HAMP domain-containing protein [Allorhizocola rhizosphaerae]|uniref:HAMP domain-containing protein n=1 Tax=Allorhizocola rhizosphaerae TaxID=1872709 RepID=UPI001FE6E60D|nr:HAMP domain-containing protein [Allorhizocola rhizosphaerae]
MASSHAVAEGLLATRLPVHGRDEFGAWAESFNRVADALESKIARERQFTADVAHERRPGAGPRAPARSARDRPRCRHPPRQHRPHCTYSHPNRRTSPRSRSG